ncbi:MAG: cytochrome c oxidase subunit 3 [Flavobacteriaceae bacterium]|jgi:cytochrome c oxidase subunit 3|nr:cytochrome c oxidase subunit 3 [Flavobacteriaceae bacterium]
MGTTANTTSNDKIWDGGNKPLNASYGKMMMWFFIVSDALTFSGFIVSYGFARFKFADSWPIADEVFTHVPFVHGKELPMIYVAFMTFVLIMSSVTMVMAVDAGHKMQKAKVTFYMFLTIIGGIIFVGSQAWEWATFIKGDYGAVKTKGGNILQFLDAETSKRVSVEDFAFEFSSVRDQHQSYNGIWYDNEGTLPTFNIEEVIAGFEANPNILIRKQILDENGHKTILSREESLNVLKETGVSVVNGANLYENEYGVPLFANFFFFITGFHGFHVFSGIVLNIIIFFNVIIGTYEKRKSYEMVEKVGLYWHFVDLVWVFVFTFFYLV